VDDGRDEGVELLKTGGHCLEAEPAFSQYPITVVTLIIAKATVLVLLLEHLFNILSGGSHKLVKYSQVSLREKVVTKLTSTVLNIIPTTNKRIFSTKGLRVEKKFTFKNRYIFIILVFAHVGWHLSILEHSQNDSVIVYNKVVYIHDHGYTTFAEEFLEHIIMIFS